MRSFAFAAAAGAAAAQSTTWTIVANDVGTIATGISFNADGKTGFLPADSNGVGASLLKSVDGGYSWNYSAPHPFALLYLDIASAGENVIAAGVLGVDFSIDGGETFNTSLSNEVAAQCTRNLYNHDNPSGFGLAGQFGLFNPTNGVAISEDFGITFTTYNANASSDARYASFPDPNIWYVASGDWPNNNEEDVAEGELPAGTVLDKKLTQKVWLLKDAATGARRVHFASRMIERNARARNLQSSSSSGSTSTNPTTTSGGGGPDEYLAQITATTDGGKTFLTQVNITGEFYFNGIECTTPTNCCVVGEADDGAFAGSYIWCSNDGGANWVQTHNNTDPASSLLDIAAVSATELWAVGGEFNSIGPAAAHFWHSTDGGATWTLASQIANFYATAIDCVQGTGQCWATVLDALQTSAVASNPSS